MVILGGFKLIYEDVGFLFVRGAMIGDVAWMRGIQILIPGITMTGNVVYVRFSYQSPNPKCYYIPGQSGSLLSKRRCD